MLPEQHRREQGILKAAFYREHLLPQGALSEILQLNQWVNWQYRFIHGEWKKVPVNPRNGHNASTINPRTWGTIHQAVKRLELGAVDGIGLVVTEADPYCFVDVDHSADKAKRIITSELGLRVATMLNTLSEFSPNDGLHFLVKLEKPLPEACKSDVEIYYTNRFLTFTFDRVPDTPLVIATRQIEIESLYAEFKGKTPSTSPPLSRRESTRGGMVGLSRGGVLEDALEWRSLPINHFDDEEVLPARPDEAVLRLAIHARNRQAFLELWENRWRGNPKFQGENGEPDDSKADWQLAKYLLYWTGGHKAQANRLFERSKLMRSKWRDRKNSGGGKHSYGEVTIFNATEYVTYQGTRKDG